MSEDRSRTAWLKGPTQPCAPIPDSPRRLNLILLGAPGVGKGTQAALLSARMGACQLSTGDLFRAVRTINPCHRTPALNAAVDAMQRGELVSDETVVALVRERASCLRCHGGFLLDGFPRTVAQAIALDQILAAEHVQLDAVVSYELPIEQLVARIGGRRVCARCKAVFHEEEQPPEVAGVCDRCGHRLEQRADDRPDAVRVRMDVYERSTRPLIDHYRERQLLVPVPAEGDPEEIFTRTLRLLASAPALARG